MKRVRDTRSYAGSMNFDKDIWIEKQLPVRVVRTKFFLRFFFFFSEKNVVFRGRAVKICIIGRFIRELLVRAWRQYISNDNAICLHQGR